MNQEEHDKIVYQNFVAKQKALGLWTERENHFDEMQKQLSVKLSLERKEKVKKQLLPEQKIKNVQYIEKVKSDNVVDYKKPNKLFETNLMPLSEAKKQVFEITKDFAAKRGQSLIFDQYNKIVYDQLTKYFIRSDEFIGELTKGICLIGNVGTGKTLIMDVFKKFTENKVNEYHIFDMKKISRDVQENGVEAVKNYTQGVCCYDDVGFEDKAAYFGNKICVFTEMINIQYNKFQKTGKICHITTNLGFNEDLGFGLLNGKYDPRVFDRVREMFNIIILKGNSKRL